MLTNDEGTHTISYTEKFGTGAVYREGTRSKAAEFPADWEKSETDEGLRSFMIPDKRKLKAKQTAAKGKK